MALTQIFGRRYRDARLRSDATRAVTRRAFLTSCFGGVLLSSAGCRSIRQPSYPKLSCYDRTAYLIASGWHTEIGLPVPATSGRLRALTRVFPGSRYLLFGWGERDYYMARTPTAADALRALIPGPAVLLVTPLYGPPQDVFHVQVFRLGLSAAGFDRLGNYIWAALNNSAVGVRRLAAGPAPGSMFYAATGTYSAFYTCNTWTAEGLRVSGLSVRVAGVVFASQVIDQVQSLSNTLYSKEKAVCRVAHLAISFPMDEPFSHRRSSDVDAGGNGN